MQIISDLDTNLFITCTLSCHLYTCTHKFPQVITQQFANLPKPMIFFQKKPLYTKFSFCHCRTMTGHAVVQLVLALDYKLESHGFDSRLFNMHFSLTVSFWLHNGPPVDSASNRNEYQERPLEGKSDRCVELTNLPPSWAKCLEIS
jgi:hypothetical protein